MSPVQTVYIVSRTCQRRSLGFHFFTKWLLFFPPRIRAEANFLGICLIHDWIIFFLALLSWRVQPCSPSAFLLSCLGLCLALAQGLHSAWALPPSNRAQTDTPTPLACWGATRHFQLCVSITSSVPATELIWFSFYLAFLCACNRKGSTWVHSSQDSLSFTEPLKSNQDLKQKPEADACEFKVNPTCRKHLQDLAQIFLGSRDWACLIID